MANPSVQGVVGQTLVVVQMVEDQPIAWISAGRIGGARPMGSVSIKEYLDAGLTERQALQRVLDIAMFAVRGAGG
ncbi:hypothetical protein [Dyella sp. AtDHG13]|uniref:hypothetical protein n=1 Tax=Dyella sp. AtDHG13 TaxID=1938897 RepID=UPI000D76EE3D|nr:hypothetical protein [Dyella sp. AtDHG13]